MTIKRLKWIALGALALAGTGCSKSNKVDAGKDVIAECDVPDAELQSLCPTGTALEITGAATDPNGICPEGAGESSADGGVVNAVCRVEANCAVRCVSTCDCGIASVSEDAVECAECPDQSCGDGRCEGTERESCAAGQRACMPCAEDCSGATCGDGDCTGEEDPSTCPEDCSSTCVPNSTRCAGTDVLICSANGQDEATTSCAAASLVCGNGACVPPNVCGNGLCEGPGESPGACPEDCSDTCQPNSTRCAGEVLLTCNANGTESTETRCTDTNLICASGACVSPNVCPNGRCEPGEDAATCQDCQIECGNGVCESGELVSCPADCAACGNGVCEQGEQSTCPQDCGVCVPGARSCNGPVLTVCSANGQTFLDPIDCAGYDQTCGNGNCVDPGVCGNGICDTGEFGVCDSDCAETCGNGTCGPGETFANCSDDCQPRCDDGICDGNESFRTCPLDCAESCNNGVCEAIEDRASCPNDCGSCGDGTCQEADESPLAFPPAGKEHCRIDCIELYCDSDDDCDDRIDCTLDSCNTGSGLCVYTTVDSLCGAGFQCLSNSGCCVDGDGDGVSDVECGGNDCDDDDPDVRPGAPEPCGGGDKNCNGRHEPAPSTPTQLTTDVDTKHDLAVTASPAGFLMHWYGTSGANNAVRYLVLDTAGQPIGAIRDLATVGGTLSSYGFSVRPIAHSAFSAGYRDQYAVFWMDDATANMRWMATDGTLAGSAPLVLPDSTAAILGTGFAWKDGVYLAHYGNKISLITEAEGAADLGFFGDRSISVTASPIGFVRTGRGPFGPDAGIEIRDTAGASIRGWALNFGSEPHDFELITSPQQVTIVRTSGTPNTTRFSRYSYAGDALGTETVMFTDVARPMAGLHNPEEDQIALLFAAGSNVNFTVVGLDGTEVLPMGSIAGGGVAERGELFWDGAAYRAFWSQPDSLGTLQAFTAQVRCE